MPVGGAPIGPESSAGLQPPDGQPKTKGDKSLGPTNPLASTGPMDPAVEVEPLATVKENPASKAAWRLRKFGNSRITSAASLYVRLAALARFDVADGSV